MSAKVAALVAAVALLFGGGGFVAGTAFAPAASPPASADASGAVQRRNAGGPGAAAAGLVTGRVISVNDGSLTIEVTTPGAEAARSVIALVGETARVVRTVETTAALSDVKAGDQVTVVGTTDLATGTVSASTVMIGGAPVFRRAGPTPTPGAP